MFANTLPTLFRPSTDLWNNWPEFSFATRREYPALNVWSNEDETVVTAELPGFAPEDVEISVEGSTLTLRGSREGEESKEEENYYRRERWSGKFERSLRLPATVDADKVEAEFSNGVLSIKLPKAESAKPKKIRVKAS